MTNPEEQHRYNTKPLSLILAELGKSGFRLDGLNPTPLQHLIMNTVTNGIGEYYFGKSSKERDPGADDVTYMAWQFRKNWHRS